ncbi:hypothetical protein BGZ95_005442, partial [Linnemannia exigua]
DYEELTEVIRGQAERYADDNIYFYHCRDEELFQEGAQSYPFFEVFYNTSTCNSYETLFAKKFKLISLIEKIDYLKTLF